MISQERVVENTGGARRRELKLDVGSRTANGHVVISTPSFSLRTHHGLVPHLTPDILDKIVRPQDALKELRMADLLEWSNNVVGDETGFQDIAQFCEGDRNSFVVSPWMLTMRNETRKNGFEDSSPSSQSFVTLSTIHGRKSISCEKWFELVKISKPAIAVILSDEISSGAGVGRGRMRKSVDRSLSLLMDCLSRIEGSREVLGDGCHFWAVVQGGGSVAERLRCSAAVSQFHEQIDGIVVGGLFSGESLKERLELVDAVIKESDPKLCRCGMGSGDPLEIIGFVERGIDICSSGFPFRAADVGCAIIFPIDQTEGEVGPSTLLLSDSEWRLSDIPLEPNCSCFTCQNHTRAYLFHLISCKEMNATIRTTLDSSSFARFAERFKTSFVSPKLDGKTIGARKGRPLQSINKP